MPIGQELARANRAEAGRGKRTPSRGKHRRRGRPNTPKHAMGAKASCTAKIHCSLKAITYVVSNNGAMTVL